MSLFRTRSFNVKLVKDADDTATETNSQDKIETAMAYAEIIKDVAASLTIMTLSVIAVKGFFDVAKIVAKN